jgi:hypothetical protein
MGEQVPPKRKLFLAAAIVAAAVRELSWREARMDGCLCGEIAGKTGVL